MEIKIILRMENKNTMNPKFKYMYKRYDSYPWTINKFPRGLIIKI